jgi:hypothetical protein
MEETALEHLLQGRFFFSREDGLYSAVYGAAPLLI